MPGDPADPVGLIDARDLAQFMLLRAARHLREPPAHDGRDTRADLMAACLAATAPAVRATGGEVADLVYLDDAWLAEQVVEAWTEIPIWIPKSEGPGVFAHRPDEAVAAGLRWRPLADSVADTWAWQQSIPGGWQPSERTPGLDPTREQNLIGGLAHSLI